MNNYCRPGPATKSFHAIRPELEWVHLYGPQRYYMQTGRCRFPGSQTGLPGLPDTQKDVGGWEDYPVVRRPDTWDTDRDGMSDEWEKSQGLNPDDADDRNTDRDADGYTNLEEYLCGLVREFPNTRSTP